MSVRKRGNKWIVDIDFEHPDGSRERIRKVSPVQTKRGAEQFERELRQALLSGSGTDGKEEKKKSPKFADFAKEFLSHYATVNNKPSEIRSKEKNLRVHLIPAFGKKWIQDISAHDIERYKAKKAGEGLSPKTVNNHLTCLRKCLSVVQEWGFVENVPPVKWLKVPTQKFDFLNFDEADAIVEHADPEWRVMILTAQKAGLRMGELLELRWADVSFQTGRMIVSRAVYRGDIGTTKGGRSRELPLCDELLIALERHFHKRGEHVFCDADGLPFAEGACKWPLWRACDRAGIRRIRWHVLRHTFASHLVMKSVPITHVQKLMGHTDIRTTMRYAHLSPNVLREAVQVLNSGTIAAQKSPRLRIVSNIN